MSKQKLAVDSMQIGKIIELAGLGFSVRSIAAYLGMSKATFDRRVAENEELKLALDQGRARAYEVVASKAFEMAASGESPSMTQFWLKSREGWSDKMSDESESDNRIIINYSLIESN